MSVHDDRLLQADEQVCTTLLCRNASIENLAGVFATIVVVRVRVD